MPGYEAVYDTIEGDILKISLAGFLDAHTAPEFENLLTDLIGKGYYKILVDMERIEYISSTGFGVFMGHIEDIREKNGDIKFLHIPEKIFRIFSILGFAAIYEILDNEKDAIEKFRV